MIADIVKMMICRNRHYLLFLQTVTLVTSLSLLLTAPLGCNGDGHSVPITTIDQRKLDFEQLGRIDIEQEELELGLTRLFEQLSQHTGQVNYRPIIKDYIPAIQKSLYYSGFCSIRKLYVNDATVDIDIYFLIDSEPPTLRIEAYLNGSTRPSVTLANHYNVTAQ
jgi:hypothetical protein